MKIRKHKRDIINRNWADIEAVLVSVMFRFKRNLTYDDVIDHSQFGRWDEISNFLDGVYWPIMDKHHCDGIFSWCNDQNLFDGDIYTDLEHTYDDRTHHNRNKIIAALDELIGYLIKCPDLVEQIIIHPSAYKLRIGNMIATEPKCVQYLTEKYDKVKIDACCIRKF